MNATEIDSMVASWLAAYVSEAVSLGELLCDRHAGGDERVALRHEDDEGVRELSFEELAEKSRKFAGVLRGQGLAPGERVAVLLPRCPELLIALVGLWRAGAVLVPLFTAFGPDAVSYRLLHRNARLLVTDVGNREKLSAGQDVPRVLCVGAASEESFDRALGAATPDEGVRRAPGDVFILLYTSGTTGRAKGVPVPVRALASFHAYMRFSLDVRPDDVYWNLADPGWGYGLWFAVIGRLLLGQTTLLRNVPFDPLDFLSAVARHGVTNLAAAPTAFRSLRAAGVPAESRRRLKLRAISSAGEPLNPELLDWSERELGCAIHDHYGQSELGMAVGFPHDPSIAIALRRASMGIATPGYRMVVVDERGEEVAAGVDGELACDVARSPLFWFSGYEGDPEKTAERFRYGRGYYLTGDGARFDADGVFGSASRVDDVITSSGYRIGPFDVESLLIGHGAVAEVAVVGTPDELRGEAVTAFVVLGTDVRPTQALAAELQEVVRERLGAHTYPRRVFFVERIPRTPSGKVQRSVLREHWQEWAATSEEAAR